MIYDAAIIGTGPSGLSAAINLKLHNKTVLWLGAKDMSAKVDKSEKIRNYPGFPEISGEELNLRLKDHARSINLEITDRMVTNAMPSSGIWMILAENDMYQARTLLLATGVAGGKGLIGEQELLGRGVSYCATCDGFLYKGKTIAVFCSSRRYEHEIADLASFAEKVYLYAAYPDCAPFPANVERLPKPIKKVQGASPDGNALRMKVTGIELSDGSVVPVDGLFCLRDSIAPASLIPGLELDGPHIAVNRNMETNLPGCYAAGDCTGRPYQITKAVGEGNIAAHHMMEYMAENAAEQNAPPE